jgi:tRNA(Ile2) C34 agmatinyltransferase TiaS
MEVRPMNAIVADDGPECPRCDAVDWESAPVKCGRCGHIPRTSVRKSIREVLDR